MKKYKKIITEFLSIIGVFWLLMELINWAFGFPKSAEIKILILTIFVVLLIIYLIYVHNIKQLKVKFNSKDLIIEIKYGDLFKEKDGHLVIGTNDVFDTELGEVIKNNSIQGQFEQKCYSGDVNRINKELEQTLLECNVVLEKKDKKLGKKMGYPIGTTVVLGVPERRFFLCAYAEMDNNCKANSDYKKIWESLNLLWEKIREKGQGYRVSMGVIGSDCARTGLSRMFLIKMIIISFISAYKKEPFTKQISIIVWNGDKQHVDLNNIKNFIEDLKIEC